MAKKKNEKINLNEAVKIAEGIYWVGSNDESTPFKCNTYLLVDNDEAVLFDPGSVLYYPQVRARIASVVPLRKISHIVVTHQDPDLCASIPKFEPLIENADIVTHTRASVLLPHYGIRSKYYCVDQHGWKLILESGRCLKFVFTPYCHFPGAFNTYDKKTGVYFSGDLFAAVSFDWSFYAGEYYEEAMRGFHEDYMPSNNILRAVMKEIEKLDIKLIAPQHGSIIKENVGRYIKFLKNLDCGYRYMIEGK
jgi:flavorubredoxin